MGHLFSGSMVGLMVTSSKRAYATCCVTQVCWTQSPCPCGRPLLTSSSTGDTQTLKGKYGSVSVGSLGPGEHNFCLRALSISGRHRVWFYMWFCPLLNQKNIYFCFIDYAKAFGCVDHKKLENSERDGNTRPPDLPLEKSICRSGSNS